MTKPEAAMHLADDPQNPIYFVERDRTGAWFDWAVVWLFDRELLMSHPTEIGHSIAAPEGNHYQFAPGAEPE